MAKIAIYGSYECASAARATYFNDVIRYLLAWMEWLTLTYGVTFTKRLQYKKKGYRLHSNVHGSYVLDVW